MLFVTFHGGKPQKNASLNNVHAFDKDGKQLTASVLDDAAGVILNELRGLCLRDDLLYVINANKDQNSILCYRGKGTKFHFVSTFASHATCPGIVHPFDITFDNAGFCYVSSQDTNVVTRLKVSKDGLTGEPAEIASALASQGHFLPGTFVASSKGKLSKPQTAPIASPAGLEYSGSGLKKHSVRGVLWAKGALYVVDQPAGRVKTYDADGKFLGQSNKINSPVHLTRHAGHLYVSGGNQILRTKLRKPAEDFDLDVVPGLRIRNGCGLVFTGKGKLYIASRTQKIIRKFDSDLKPLKFSLRLPDNPEFLLHVP